MIASLPEDQMWRHNQAGDLPGIGNRIDAAKLRKLAVANAGRPVICYTHKPLTDHNVNALREAKSLGFQIVVSTDDPLKAHDLGFPAAIVMSGKFARTKTESVKEYKKRIEADRPDNVAICPATYLDDVSCATCGACATLKPGQSIGFPIHGTSAKKAEKVLA